MSGRDLGYLWDNCGTPITTVYGPWFEENHFRPIEFGGDLLLHIEGAYDDGGTPCLSTLAKMESEIKRAHDAWLEYDQQDWRTKKRRDRFYETLDRIL